MTFSRYKKSAMGETPYTCGGRYAGIPKETEVNWVTFFRTNNPTKTFKDIFNLPQFQREERHYHYMIVECTNVKHGLLFYDGKCVADAWSNLESVEID